MKRQILTHHDFRWLSFPDPGADEIDYLKQNYPFHPLNLEDYLGKTQSPKIDKYRLYTLVVLDIPYFDTQQERITVGEVDFFLGPDYLVCLYDSKLTALNDVFERCKKNPKTLKNFLGRGPAYLFYRLADLLVDNFFPVLDKISQEIETIDRDIWEAPKKAMVGEISLQRRNTVVVQTMVKPTLPIFERLERGDFPDLNQEMAKLWGNILDHLQKIWEKLEDNRELIEGLATSNESLLSYKTNEIVKILTMFSTILLPLTLLASIYGMNIVGLPLAGTPISLIFILLLMLTIGGGLFVFFKFKGWV